MTFRHDQERLNMRPRRRRAPRKRRELRTGHRPPIRPTRSGVTRALACERVRSKWPTLVGFLTLAALSICCG